METELPLEGLDFETPATANLIESIKPLPLYEPAKVAPVSVRLPSRGKNI
jgi:hypothetical protein